MGIRQNWTKADIKRAIKERIAAYRNAITDQLKFSGEEFISLAREKGNYMDHTGNLRNSVGYMIFYGRRLIASEFVGSDGPGKKEGRKVANRIARDHSDGYIFVGVAGMDYAAAVESKGKDVITGSAKVIEKLLKKSLKSLNKNFNV